MRRTVSYSFLLLVLGVLTGGCNSARVQFGPLHDGLVGKRIAVVSSDGETKVTFDWTLLVAGNFKHQGGDLIAGYLETELLGTYRIMERGTLEKVLEEHSLSSTDLVDPETAIQVGKLAGLDGIVLVRSSGGYFWIFPAYFAARDSQAKLIDVETGEIAWSANVNFSAATLIPFIPIWINIDRRAALAMGDEIARR